MLDDEDLASMMRDHELRRERGEIDDDEDGDDISGERDPLRRSSSTSFSSPSGVASPWRRRVKAALSFCDVFVEIGRRLLRLVELNVPRYIAFVDRCLVHVIRVSVHPRKRVNTLRLLLTILLIASIPYLIVTIYRVQLASYSDQESVELTEDRIRPIIIIEHVEEPIPTRRQAMLRNGGDGLRSDHVELSCANTRQGAVLLTDATGHVCTRRQLDRLRPGCCNEMDTSLPRIKQFACDSCDTRPPHCCDVYEHCVSCCMHPLNVELRRDYLIHVDLSHPLYQDPSNLTVFEYCASRCRTSSSSIHHQNSYRSRRAFCYGIHRPLQVLPTVNSDGDLLLSDVHDTNEPSIAQLETDPFYRRSR